ncbi:arylacetamide deacetylase [Spea bombifrons]|uniref:arylacetamide deacetylase n=1 Tax=Spea bombifrons TaxID=233779 RepID=UPI00234981AA|nr:arylacetamide deacetylase [Spea bombifrons]
MASRLLCLGLVSVLLAYYIYTPLPDNIEEKWKATLLDVTFRSLGHVSNFAELLGIKHYMDVMMFLTYAENTEPTSDENVTVTDTLFNNVPVRLYIPKKSTEALKSGVIYIHGGGWCLGSAAMKPYDLLSRRTAQKLGAVVVSIEYRLAPRFQFPTQFDDVYTVVKFFLDKTILNKYSVDPDRVAVAGDSAGGNLAAAVAQQLLKDPEVNIKLKVQALIYPVLQDLDLHTPSYQENGKMPLLSSNLMVRFWCEYITTDRRLCEAMLSNRHIPLEAADLFKFVNWSSLLPEDLKKNHIYSPQFGHSEFVKKYPGILDERVSPLLAKDEQLKGLPLTYVITCMYDVLRDDGFMYVSRLKKMGVQVVHHHYDNTFHGILLLNNWPLDFQIAHHIEERYLNWLKENL